MVRIQSIFLSLVLLFSEGVFAAQSELGLDLKNAHVLSDNLVTGGQPSQEDLKRLKVLGFTNVISLRQVGEVTEHADPEVAKQFNFQEAELAASLGLTFTSLPVSSKDGIAEENARKLDVVLSSATGPVLLHCGSGNRAGALMALRAFYVQGMSAEDALQAGKNAGLTKLEPMVRQEMGLAPQE